MTTPTEIADEILALLPSMTDRPWSWMPPGHGNGDRNCWSIGETLEDDPPVLLGVNWHQESNVKGVVQIINRADTLASAVKSLTTRLAEAEGKLERAMDVVQAARKMHNDASGGHYMVAEDMFAFECAIQAIDGEA